MECLKGRIYCLLLFDCRAGVLQGSCQHELYQQIIAAMTQEEKTAMQTAILQSAHIQQKKQQEQLEQQQSSTTAPR